MTAGDDELEATLIQGAAEAGPSIPDVTIEATLGTGGQGIVYAGKQEYLNRRVAVKLLHKHVNPKLAQRFRREATILAGLHHPNVVTCYSAGVTADEQCFMVMEFIDGPDLQVHVKEHGPLEEPLALELVADVARALMHGLEAGVIHRDVKPQNVLLKSVSSTDGRELVAKLADLGLARFTDDQGEGMELTAQGAVLGTPTTMAPEQSDDPDGVDHRTDIYGLGCVLYWSLTGQRAFEAKSMAALYRLKTSGKGLDAIRADERLSAGSKALVVSMLAADPADRVQTYDDLLAAIDAVRAGTAPKLSGRPSGSRRGLWVGAGGALALAAIAAAGYQLTRAAPEPVDDIEEAQVEAEDSPSDVGSAAAVSESRIVAGWLPEGESPATPGPTVDAPQETSTGGAAPTVGQGEPAARDVRLAPSLPAGAVSRPFAGTKDQGTLLTGWRVRQDDRLRWIPSDSSGNWDQTVVRAKAGLDGQVNSISQDAPAGDWQLSGVVSVGPYGQRRTDLRAGIELQRGPGRKLRIEVIHGGGDEPSIARALWLDAGAADPPAARIEVDAPQGTVPYFEFASTTWLVSQSGGRVFVSLQDSEPLDITPEGDEDVFEELRLYADTGFGLWRDLEYLGL